MRGGPISGLRDLHRMQLALDVLFPEGEEALQLGIARRDIELLPDEALDQVRVVGQVVEDLGRGQPVSLKLLANDLLGEHA